MPNITGATIVLPSATLSAERGGALQEEFELAKDYTPVENDWLSSVWEGFKTPAQRSRIRNTGAPDELLKDVTNSHVI